MRINRYLERVKKYMQREESEDQDIELFAERVREHILKEHFLNTLDQHTPQKNPNQTRAHPKSDFLVKWFGDQPTKFVDQNNMRISAFHTNVVQGKTSVKDSGVLLKNEPPLIVESKNESPKGGQNVSKVEGESGEKSGKGEQGKEGQSKKKGANEGHGQIRIELGNMEKELYEKMETMQIAHKEKMNQVILDKEKAIDEIQKDREKLDKVLPMFVALKKHLSKTKKTLLKQVNQAKEEIAHKILSLQRDTPTPAPMSIFEACDFILKKKPKDTTVQTNIVSHINFERQKLPRPTRADSHTQTGKKTITKEVGCMPHFDYSRRPRKPVLRVQEDPDQSYNYQSESLFEVALKSQNEREQTSQPRYKFRNRKRLEQKIIEKFIVVDKENEENENLQVQRKQLLGKRAEMEEIPNSKSRFVNSKSILNLNKLFGQKREDQSKEISEFPMYPKRKKKRKRQITFDCFQNSVRITNLVGEKGLSAEQSKPAIHPKQAKIVKNSQENSGSKQLVGKECMAAFLSIKKV